jgi:sec-independent protein translocase protein TatC
VSDEDSLDAGKMPLLDHLIELRRRLIYSVIALIAAWGVCYYFSQDLLDFLLQPLYRALPPGADVQYIDLTEAFVTRVKIAFWAACLIAFPVIASQVWMFVAPGLYKNEKRAFLPYLVATPVLFVLGASLALLRHLPRGLALLPELPDHRRRRQSGHRGPPAGGRLSVAVDDADLRLRRGVPDAGRAHAAGTGGDHPEQAAPAVPALCDRRQLCVLRRSCTPPDPFSMMALAVPLWLLYEISIWSCRLRRAPAAAARGGAGRGTRPDDPKA